MRFLVRNESGEEIPAWAVMLVTDIYRLDNNRLALKVGKVRVPALTAGFQRILINGPKPIDINGYGHGDDPATAKWVRYQTTGSDPAFGSMWGVVDDSWEIEENGAGFYIFGDFQESRSRVQVQFIPFHQGYFILQEDLSAPSKGLSTQGVGDGETALATLITGYATGSSGQSITVTNRWNNLTLSAQKGGVCYWDWVRMEWAIVATECP